MLDNSTSKSSPKDIFYFSNAVDLRENMNRLSFTVGRPLKIKGNPGPRKIKTNQGYYGKKYLKEHPELQGGAPHTKSVCYSQGAIVCCDETCAFEAKIGWTTTSRRQKMSVFHAHTCAVASTVESSSVSMSGSITHRRDLKSSECDLLSVMGKAGIDIQAARRLFTALCGSQRYNAISSDLFSREFTKARKSEFGASAANINRFVQTCSGVKTDGGVFEYKFDNAHKMTSFVVSTKLMQQLIEAYGDLVFGNCSCSHAVYSCNAWYRTVYLSFLYSRLVSITRNINGNRCVRMWCIGDGTHGVTVYKQMVLILFHIVDALGHTWIVCFGLHPGTYTFLSQ